MRPMLSLNRSSTVSADRIAAQDAAALLARLGYRPKPVKPPRDWLWDGLSPAGREKLILSWTPPGLRWKPEPDALL